MNCSIYVIPVSNSETLSQALHANLIVVIKVKVTLNTFTNRWEGDYGSGEIQHCKYTNYLKCYLKYTE